MSSGCKKHNNIPTQEKKSEGKIYTKYIISLVCGLKNDKQNKQRNKIQIQRT